MIRTWGYVCGIVALACCFGKPAQAQCVATDDGSGVKCFTLIAGQTIDAGNLCVSVVGDDLVVTYSTHEEEGWELVAAHLWVGSSLDDLPQTNSGNPIPGQFPYGSGDISGETVYSFWIPLSTLGFACPSDAADFYLAAHADVQRVEDEVVVQTEGAWSDGDRITERGNWATVSSFTLVCDCEQQCQTAFAAGGACFLDIDEDGDGAGDFHRWGWSIGPLEPGTSETYPVYAGAAQCDPSKGTLVGTLEVDYEEFTGLVTISYVMSGDFTLAETHLYVGNEILPRRNGIFTVAPGQYPYSHSDLGGALEDTYAAIAMVGDVYVVAHAVVCGFFD